MKTNPADDPAVSEAVDALTALEERYREEEQFAMAESFREARMWCLFTVYRDWNREKAKALMAARERITVK
jgi:hypothetical protein